MTNVYGPWLTGTAYLTNDQVGSGGSIWKAKQANTAHTPATGAYWALVRGPSNQGTWTSTTDYCVGDTVTYRGSVWTCSIASVNVVPAVGANWSLVQSAPFNVAAAKAQMTGSPRGVDLLPVYATSSRPSASASGAGASYYDATLSKPGFSNGTVWKDAAGTTI